MVLNSGDVFAGFTIERLLGQGGMGSVYLARHPRLGKLTALKLLNRELVADREIRARFDREADLVAQLDHPSIVEIYDRGVEDGMMWISMQYIDGVDAASVDVTQLPPDRAVQIIEGVAAALDYAHAMGVLHRDVKPANIILARAVAGHGERVFLTDFGIARLREDSTHLTQAGMFTATLAYASPEQMTGGHLDHTSDQYSLACALYWLLIGAGPFDSPHPAELIRGHLQLLPPPVSLRRPGLTPAMDAVITKGMAKRAMDRFPSCTDFAKAARRALTAPAPTPQIPTATPQLRPSGPTYRPAPAPGSPPNYAPPGYAAAPPAYPPAVPQPQAAPPAYPPQPYPDPGYAAPQQPPARPPVPPGQQIPPGYLAPQQPPSPPPAAHPPQQSPVQPAASIPPQGFPPVQPVESEGSTDVYPIDAAQATPADDDADTTAYPIEPQQSSPASPGGPIVGETASMAGAPPMREVSAPVPPPAPNAEAGRSGPAPDPAGSVARRENSAAVPGEESDSQPVERDSAGVQEAPASADRTGDEYAARQERRIGPTPEPGADRGGSGDSMPVSVAAEGDSGASAPASVAAQGDSVDATPDAYGASDPSVPFSTASEADSGATARDESSPRTDTAENAETRRRPDMTAPYRKGSARRESTAAPSAPSLAASQDSDTAGPAAVGPDAARSDELDLGTGPGDGASPRKSPGTPDVARSAAAPPAADRGSAVVVGDSGADGPSGAQSAGARAGMDPDIAGGAESVVSPEASSAVPQGMSSSARELGVAGTPDAKAVESEAGAPAQGSQSAPSDPRARHPESGAFMPAPPGSAAPGADHGAGEAYWGRGQAGPVDAGAPGFATGELPAYTTGEMPGYPTGEFAPYPGQAPGAYPGGPYGNAPGAFGAAGVQPPQPERREMEQSQVTALVVLALAVVALVLLAVVVLAVAG
ncbi:protein kinase domain-containing protein [Nocardia huaxiensis]|uniref:protein kinase domain-containing protein n=1 Tax=Nocardia huaxiensis TaxID=2755382 RepID=UPI003084676F